MKHPIPGITSAKIITLSKIFVSDIKFFLAFIFITYQFSAYSQFYTNFSTSDLEQCWIGDRDKFIIDPIYGLKLYDSDFETKSTQFNQFTAYISTIYDATKCDEWSFNIFLNLNTSAYNFARIYIHSASPEIVDTDGSIYLMIGGSRDELSLYINESGYETKICGVDKVLDQNYSFIYVNIKRDDDGVWTLIYDVNDSDYSGDTRGNCDAVLTSSTYISILCNYTKTYNGKFFFGSMSATGTETDDGNINQGKDEGKEEGTTGKDEDKETDVNEDGEENSEHAKPYESGDIIISEIMANPKNAPSLPDVEYIEIHNRLETDISLMGSVFFYDTKEFILPDSLIESKGYRILCKSQYSTLMPDPENIIPLPSFPILANTGKNIGLLSPAGDTLHAVAYTDSWYGDKTKKGGGWSLEMADTDRFVEDDGNWSASTNPSGGTPGFVNSIVYDNSKYDHIIKEDSLRVGLWLINKQLSLSENTETDELVFGYRFPEEGYKASVYIYNKSGRLITTVMKNEILAGEGTFNAGVDWKSTDIHTPGIYIIYTQLSSVNGNIDKRKEVLVVTP